MGFAPFVAINLPWLLFSGCQRALLFLTKAVFWYMEIRKKGLRNEIEVLL